MLLRAAALGAGALRWTTSWPPCLRSGKGMVAAGVDSAEEEGSLSVLAAEATRSCSSQWASAWQLYWMVAGAFLCMAPGCYVCSAPRAAGVDLAEEGGSLSALAAYPSSIASCQCTGPAAVTDLEMGPLR